MTCNRCNKTPCSCGPSPFYTQFPMCKEDNTCYVYKPTFYFSLCPINSWNIPSCGLTASLSVPGIQGISVGAYLYNSSFGYFKISSVDITNGTIDIVNTCLSGNAAPGTQIPECSCFILTDPPANATANPTDCNAVAVDFTAPALHDCIDITVTGVTDLIIGKTIQIGPGRYNLSNIKSSTLITICNTGDGITPGTAVIAKDSSGQYIYCVSLLDTNPCTNPAVTSGSLLVCSGGIAQPLDGAVDGSVPVLTDAATNTVEYRILGLPTRTCTVLTADLTIISGTATYTILVADSTGFSIGDILQIGTRTDRFTVSGTPSAVLVSGVLAPVPGATTVVLAGTTICNVDCCETITASLHPIEPLLEAQCVPQETLTDVALDAYKFSVTIDGDFYFEKIVNASQVHVVLPAGSCNYSIEADLSVAVQLDFISNPASCGIYSEVEVVWVPAPANRFGGRMVWYETFDTGISVGYPPQPLLTAVQLGPPAAMDYPLMVQQGDIHAIQHTVGGTAFDLAIFFRTFTSDDDNPVSYSTVQLLLSGQIRIKRIP